MPTTVTPLLNAGIRIPRGHRESFTGHLQAVRMVAAFSIHKRDGSKLELRQSEHGQVPPELCAPLFDPHVIAARDDGTLLGGHQISVNDSVPIFFHQEWWCVGDLPEGLL